MKWLLSILGASAVAGVLALVAVGARDGRGHATAAVELDHPPSAVFPLLVQPPLRKQWLLGVEEISPVGDPTLRSGARARVVLDTPERMEVEEEIRVVEADKRVLLQRVCSHPPFSQRLEYVLKDLGGGRTLLHSSGAVLVSSPYASASGLTRDAVRISFSPRELPRLRPVVEPALAAYLEVQGAHAATVAQRWFASSVLEYLEDELDRPLPWPRDTARPLTA